MFERRAFPALVLTLALLSGSAGAQIEQVTEDEYLAPLGSALRSYAEARTAGRGIDAAVLQEHMARGFGPKTNTAFHGLYLQGREIAFIDLQHRDCSE